MLSGLGTLGDCAAESSAYYLLLSDSTSVHNLTNCDTDFQRLMESRQIMASVGRVTLWDGPIWRGLHLGMDNRRPLPPFIPVGRGEDYMYSEVVTRCFPCYLYALLPFLIVHNPLENRFRADWWNGFGFLEYASVLSLLLPSQSATEVIDTPSRRLAFIAQSLQNWGEADICAFRENVCNHVVRAAANLLSLIERRIKDLQHRPLATAGLAAFRDVVMKRILGLRSPTPIESSLEWINLRRSCLRFGQLLSVWPELVNSAKALNPAERFVKL